MGIHPSRPAILRRGPLQVVCTGALDLGATASCTLPNNGGIARYDLTVPAADTLRVHAVSSRESGDATVSVFDGDGAQLCNGAGASAFDCAVPAGSYRVDASDTRAMVLSTTVVGVLEASCAAAPDVSADAAPTAVHIEGAGSSWCAALTRVPAQAVLDVIVQAQRIHQFDYAVYDASGVRRCGEVVGLYFPHECAVGGHAAARIFVSPTVSADATVDAAIALPRVSHPIGCAAGDPDPFGTGPSRAGTVGSDAPVDCYTVPALAGDLLFARASVTGSTYVISEVRDEAGVGFCSVNGELTDCEAPSDGAYSVFVLAPTAARASYRLTLVDLSSGAGCVQRTNTGWDAHPTEGHLTVGRLDCVSFTATAGDRLLITEFGVNTTHDVLAPDGVLDDCSRNECTAPSTGTYRLVVRAVPNVQTAVDYTAWITDTNTTRGCTRTAPDHFGTAPSRIAQLGGDVLQVCYRFAVPGGSTFRTTEGTSNLSTSVYVRSQDGSFECAPICTFATAGEQLLVVRKLYADPQIAGPVTVGLWRMDGSAPSCPRAGTSVRATPVTGNLGVAQLDCRRVELAPGDAIFVGQDASHRSAEPQLVDSVGTAACSIFITGTCTLTGQGPYRVIVSSVGGPTSYAVRILALTAAGGCRELGATVFGHAPTRSFSLSGPLDAACYLIAPAVSTRPSVGVRTVAAGPPATVTPFTSSGHSFCDGPAEFGTCFLAETQDAVLVLTAAQATSGTFGWYDLSTPQGCANSLPLTFGTPARHATIDDLGAVVCRTLPVETDDRLRLAFGTVPAGMVLHGVGPSSSFTSTDADVATGYVYGSTNRYLYVWADDTAVVRTGSFGLHAWRLADARGCTAAGSLQSLSPVVGTLSDRNYEACYRVTTRVGTVRLTTSNDDVPADVPLAEVYSDASGRVTCSIRGSGSCKVRGPNVLIIVRRAPQSADFTGTFRVEATCTDGTCGP